MRYFTLTFCMLALAAVVPNYARSEAPESPTIEKALQGRWEIVRGVNQGRELSEIEVDGTYVTITANSIVTYDRESQARYQAVFTISEQLKDKNEKAMITMQTVDKDSSTKPITAAQLDKNTALGILKFDGESSWVLCYALPGSERPEKFESPEGSKNMLFKLERKKVDPIPVIRSPED